MTRTILIDSGIAKGFWAKAVNTACYLVNRCMIRPLLNKTSYELLNGWKPKLTHLRTFDLNDKNDKNDQDGEQSLVPGKIIDMPNGKTDMMSHIEESNEEGATIYPTDGEEPGPSITTSEAENRVIDAVQRIPHADMRSNQGIQTRSKTRNSLAFSITYEFGNPIKNKARLVVQGYNQEEVIDYDETFASVARMEAIKIFIAFASHMKFTLFQMDVRNAFLNSFLKEVVFVKQFPGFEHPEHPEHILKLDKALYGLKHSLRA
ncbi:uncharacterized protein LOC142162007 [Nicotiana tabacum]|uniref:Uncharacterized protein LOC142162007 n=1 Tax=Nicotiana tabacum TaxID=4097 RepID=A0AC58RNU2_TOBAC